MFQPGFRLALFPAYLLAAASCAARPGISAPASMLAPPPAQVVAWFGLDPFYRKHVTVNGLPVLGSANANDTALLEAAQILGQWLSGDKGRKVIDALIRNKIRVGVMAGSEATTDIPEHRDLAPAGYWDKRARGLGATRARPIVTCAEENLLNRRNDRYAGENILIHEFAHGIHQMGLRYIDSTFEPALLQAYDRAMKSGLWLGEYASVNEAEYWAEGVQSWFNANLDQAGGPPGADQHASLLAYDAELAALIGKAFETPWRYRRYADRAPAAYAPGTALPIYDAARFPAFAEKQSPTAMVPMDSADRAAIRAILDANGLLDVDPSRVSDRNSAGRVTGLNLADRGLIMLPPAIGRLSALKSLHLYRNGLTALPAEIGRLGSLETLLLSGNALAALPAEIGNLPKLQELILDDNRLTSLPAEMASLRQLWFLMLNGNRLTALPAGLGSFTGLHILSLEDNQLASLPAGITRLSPTTHLLADRNALCSLLPDQQTWLDAYSFDQRWRETQRCGEGAMARAQAAGRMRFGYDPAARRIEAEFPAGAAAPDLAVEDSRGRRVPGNWELRRGGAVWTAAPQARGLVLVRVRSQAGYRAQRFVL
jgi:hypothetical protein